MPRCFLTLEVEPRMRCQLTQPLCRPLSPFCNLGPHVEDPMRFPEPCCMNRPQGMPMWKDVLFSGIWGGRLSLHGHREDPHLLGIHTECRAGLGVLCGQGGRNCSPVPAHGTSTVVTAELWLFLECGRDAGPGLTCVLHGHCPLQKVTEKISSAWSWVPESGLKPEDAQMKMVSVASVSSGFFHVTAKAWLEQERQRKWTWPELESPMFQSTPRSE